MLGFGPLGIIGKKYRWDIKPAWSNVANMHMAVRVRGCGSIPRESTHLDVQTCHLSNCPKSPLIYPLSSIISSPLFRHEPPLIRFSPHLRLNPLPVLLSIFVLTSLVFYASRKLQTASTAEKKSPFDELNLKPYDFSISLWFYIPNQPWPIPDRILSMRREATVWAIWTIRGSVSLPACIVIFVQTCESHRWEWRV